METDCRLSREQRSRGEGDGHDRDGEGQAEEMAVAEEDECGVFERDDLPAIGRISQNFLVPGHGGIEHYLARSNPFGAYG